MAYKIFYTEDALIDLEILLDHISGDNPTAAERVGESLLNHVELLREFPEMRITRSGPPFDPQAPSLADSSFTIASDMTGK